MSLLLLTIYIKKKEIEFAAFDHRKTKFKSTLFLGWL